MVLPTVTRRFLTDGICRGGNPTGEFGRRKMRSMAFKAALAAIIVSVPMAGAFAKERGTMHEFSFQNGPSGGNVTDSPGPSSQAPATTATINPMPLHRHHHHHHHKAANKTYGEMR